MVSRGQKVGVLLSVGCWETAGHPLEQNTRNSDCPFLVGRISCPRCSECPSNWSNIVSRWPSAWTSGGCCMAIVPVCLNFGVLPVGVYESF